MNIFGHIFSLTIALTAASTGIASACCTLPDPCSQSVSCRAQRAIGGVTVVQPKVTTTTKPAPPVCYGPTACIRGGSLYVGSGPFKPGPATAADSTTFASFFARFFSE